MTPSQLVSIFEKGRLIPFLPHWDGLVSYADLSSDERVAMFLAQVGHECQSFTRFEENLNYRATTLARTWPQRYAIHPKAQIKKPNGLAVSISGRPELIANITYAGRMGNGDIGSGDGWRYRGRGCMMTTGLSNYQDLDEEFTMNGKILANPDMLLTPYWAIMSAGFYWKRHNLNSFADKTDIVGARKKINGGLIGLYQVTQLYSRIITIANTL